VNDCSCWSSRTAYSKLVVSRPGSRTIDIYLKIGEGLQNTQRRVSQNTTCRNRPRRAANGARTRRSALVDSGQRRELVGQFAACAMDFHGDDCEIANVKDSIQYRR
jgi:hypothetical protein